MPEMIENRMTVDSQWEEVEKLQMRIPSRHAKRWKQIFDEMENETEEEDE